MRLSLFLSFLLVSVKLWFLLQNQSTLHFVTTSQGAWAVSTTLFVVVVEIRICPKAVGDLSSGVSSR